MSDQPDSTPGEGLEPQPHADLTAWDLGAIPTRPSTVRILSAIILVASVAVLAVAFSLTPAVDEHGNRMGTHTQIPGFAKCGMIVATGLPCPTCGMTTAFAHTVRGQLVQAFLAQPTGLILALATLLAVPLTSFCLFTGRLPAVQIPIVTPYRLLLTLLVLLVAGWAFKLFAGLANGTLPAR